MKKYYLSHIDFSEIANVTANVEHLEKSKARMVELELLTEKGNPAAEIISTDTLNVSIYFFIKLNKRLRRRNGGIFEVRDTFKKLLDNRDYYGFYFYMAFMYGFLEWQVPERFSLYPAHYDALKLFCKEFMKDFDSFISGIESAESEESTDNGSKESI